MTAIHATKAAVLPKLQRDWLPVLLVPIVVIVAFPLIGNFSGWLTLTVAGLAMGMMIFIMASGLTLVFGLMDVLNFGHGVFISIGAFAVTLVVVPLATMVQADSVLANVAVLLLCAVVAMRPGGYMHERPFGGATWK